MLKRDITINVYKDNETVPRASIIVSKYSSDGGSSSKGSWIDIPASGIAPADGIIIVTSTWNTNVTIETSGVLRTQTHRRDKYGQGCTSTTCAVAKGENYVITGSKIIQFFKLN